MKTPFKTLVLFLCLLSPAYSWADKTNYSFDTVTEIDLDGYNPSISGIEKDTGNPLTVSFGNKKSINQYIVNRCVPVFLTAIEKPGRYYLHLIADPMNRYAGLTSCRLEVKN